MRTRIVAVCQLFPEGQRLPEIALAGDIRVIFILAPIPVLVKDLECQNFKADMHIPVIPGLADYTVLSGNAAGLSVLGAGVNSFAERVDVAVFILLPFVMRLLPCGDIAGKNTGLA